MDLRQAGSNRAQNTANDNMASFGMALLNGAHDCGAKESTRKPNFGTVGPIIIIIIYIYIYIFFIPEY